MPTWFDPGALAGATGTGSGIAAERSSIPTIPPRPAPDRAMTLRGFATVELPIGLVIEGCSVHVSNGRAWAALPARPMLDSAGAAIRDDRGKIKYAPVLAWRDRNLGDRWSDAVIELVQVHHPGALDDGGAP
jgi:hypothetical protein